MRSSANSWLAAIPTRWKRNYILAKSEFQIGLQLRFILPLNNGNRVCPALNCKAPLDPSHIDPCKATGVIIRRHGMIRNIIAKHMQEDYGEGPMVLEPLLDKIEVTPAADYINGNDNASRDGRREYKETRK